MSASASSSVRKRRSGGGGSPSEGDKAPVARSPSDKGDALAKAAPSSFVKFWTRVIVGFAMIGAFGVILYGGHMYAWLMVVILQILLFRELVNVRYRAAAEKNIPWFRSVQWMWFSVALFFNYGESFGAFIENKKIRFVPPIVVHYLRYHTWVSFTMYAILFVMSVLSLKKGYYKYQMGQYTWTIVTLGLIVFQMKYILTNIFNGLIWFVFPVSLVVCNDCFAFFCGKLFGKKFVKTPFLRLSPNKTWEGFIGAFICTIVFGYFSSAWLAKFQWMICPLESLQLLPDPLTCTPSDVFVPRLYTLPAVLARYIGREQITYLPIQLHSIVFSMFASFISPFGGFYASAIKRTYNLKDFDSVIPGHGGVMDRMDCQLITACFTSVYYNTFIRSTTPTIAMILNLVSRLGPEEQKELLQRIQEIVLVTYRIMANEELQLRVKNLPGALSGAAVTALLSHYGATRVKVLKHKKHDATQAAVAVFASQQTQQQALERLQRLELMRQKLKVEIVSSKSAHQPKQQQSETEAGAVDQQKQPPLPPGPPPPLAPNPVHTSMFPSPAPLAPHLGLNYAPSPLFVYKYPKATENIVRNIANALIALPKLYTQVLHLMNKMNLPPPFEDEAIPGIFSKRHEAAASKRQKRPRPGAPVPQQQLVEEDEDDGEVQNAQTEDPTDQIQTKKQRTDGNSGVQLPLPSQLSLYSTTQGRKTLLEKSKRVPAFSEDVGHAFVAKQDLSLTQTRRPGVISKEELSRQKLPPSELLNEPMIAAYERGVTSSAVLAGNIAATADEQDLVYVFGHVLPLGFSISALHIQLDRVANTAKIEFPNERIAEAAVDEIHGFVLEGKPLLVRFHPQAAGEPVDLCDTSQHASNSSESVANTEESSRFDAAALSQEKAMRNYQRGEPSSVLYVKNLAKSIQMSDLIAVFGSALPTTVDSDVLNIRHFTEGRMKFQAFVEFPSVELASKALEKTQGLVVQGKPLVVCYRKSTPPTPAAP